MSLYHHHGQTGKRANGLSAGRRENVHKMAELIDHSERATRPARKKAKPDQPSRSDPAAHGWQEADLGVLRDLLDDALRALLVVDEHGD